MKKGYAIYYVAAGLLALILTGCSVEDVTARSVEEEVTEALVGDADEASEYEITPESGLEYVETEDVAVEIPDIEEPDEALMTDAEFDTVPMETTEADNEGNTDSEIEEPNVDTLQIVFMGDSIFDAVRDETGIAHIVGTELGADIYNLAIGGTTAGLTRIKSTDLATWNEPSFLGVLYCMEGKVDRKLISGYKSGEVMETLDPSKTDYFIIQYGTNDFLSYIPTGSIDMGGQYYFYFSSSLRIGIRELQEHYPNAQIIICTPYYEQFWSADRTRFIGDIHSVNNGYGTLLDYIGSAEGVANEENVTCLNMYDLMGIDAYTVDKMTEDGIHPNEEARRKYADILISKLREMGADKTEAAE